MTGDVIGTAYTGPIYIHIYSCKYYIYMHVFIYVLCINRYIDISYICVQVIYYFMLYACNCFLCEHKIY